MRSRSLLVLVLVCGLAGCPKPGPAPLHYLTGVDVSQVVQGESPTVTAQISIPGMDKRRVRSISMEIRSTREPNRPFVPVIAEATSPTGGNTWTAGLPPLNVGPYEVRLTARYMPFDPPNLPVGEDLVDVTVRAFSVGVDEVECFSFASGLQGWTFDGFRAGGQTLAPTCNDALFHLPGPGGGMIVVATGPCAPAAIQPGTLMSFDFVSPGVASRPGWSDAEGVMLRRGGTSDAATSAHLLLTGGVEAAGSPVQGTSSVGQTNQFHMIDMPSETAVDRLRARVTIPDGSIVAGLDASERLDAVCPLPPRPW